MEFYKQILYQCLKELKIQTFIMRRILFYFWFYFSFYFDILHLEPNIPGNLRKKLSSFHYQSL